MLKISAQSAALILSASLIGCGAPATPVPVAVPVSNSGPERVEIANPISAAVTMPGARAVEFKVIHSDNAEEEADRELVRQYLASELGMEFSEIEWTHSKDKFASFENAPDYVRMWRAYKKTDAEIQSQMDEINRSRLVDFKAAGRDLMSFSICDGKVKRAHPPKQD